MNSSPLYAAFRVFRSERSCERVSWFLTRAYYKYVQKPPLAINLLLKFILCKFVSGLDNFIFIYINDAELKNILKNISRKE